MTTKPGARLAALTLAAVAGGGGAAFAQSVDASSPEALAAIIRGYGSADIETDSLGDPMIVGRIDGLSYQVIFNDCTDNADCKVVQFRSGFDLDQGMSYDRINDWNDSRKFGTAFLDEEGDPFLKMTVNLTYGVSRRNFDDTVDWWVVAVKDFAEFTGFR
jgi:hypothetical protein